MAEYTLTLRSEEDYDLIKRLLKHFEGASIRPCHPSATHLEESLKAAERGEVYGPYTSAKEMLDDLLD